MVRSLYLTLVYAAFLILGLSAPFVFSLGYVWVDTFVPQSVAYAILPQIPVSLIMGAAAFGGYLLLDTRSPPPLSMFTVLMLALAVWVTLSTAFWAVVPDPAWTKWNWAFKTLVFSAFLPFVFRSRVQIEAFLQIYLFALVVNFMPVGIKTLISGGGYGRTLTVGTSDSGITETSTLAGVSMMLIPLIFYLKANTRILRDFPFKDWLYTGLAVAALAAAVGTYARTALVGMAVVAVGMWLRTRRKFVFGLMIFVAAAGVMLFTSDAWNKRISTIEDYQQEDSALGRILVWKWTLGYVADHPLGGGFETFRIDRIEFPATGTNPEPLVVIGKAFHSVYFEMLGEQGWVGLGIFGTLIAGALLVQHRVARRTRNIPEMAWCRELAFALQVSLLTLLACGAFIGIAFQPMIYYMLAITTCLGNYVRRALPAQAASEWRQRQLAPAVREAPAMREAH